MVPTAQAASKNKHYALRVYVEDNLYSPLVGALVINEGVTAYTDSTGHAYFYNIQPRYNTLTVSMPGYQTFTEELWIANFAFQSDPIMYIEVVQLNPV